MARKGLIEKEKKREYLVALKQDKRDYLKKIIADMSKSEEERMKAVDDLNRMPRNSSRVRLRRRCKLTGRPRGNLRKFGMSRLCFREKASAGYLPGVYKASW